jgi:hypothetical protein
MSSRHVSHTGNRVTLSRGALQKRHAEGKMVEKTLEAAVPNADFTEAIEEPRVCGSTLSVRVRSPLLLKTTLLSPAVKLDLFISIAAPLSRFNHLIVNLR